MKIKKMNNISKRFCIILFLAMLLVCSTYTALIPSARASEATLQQKGLTILNSAVGFDLTKYSVMTNELPQISYLDGMQQENIQYNLQSNTSNLQILCTFTNGSLRIMHITQNTDSTLTTVSVTSPLDMAKSFLSNYQIVTGNAFYGDLKSDLNAVDDSKNSTSVTGNIRLAVGVSADSTTFRWTYICDGVEAPAKCVALSYSNGFLDYFVDNWNLYTIGTTAINLPEKTAVTEAVVSAKNFSWTMGTGNNTYQFKDFNVTQAMIWETIFSNGVSADSARDSNPFVLYPMRHVWVSLDKFYPGNVYGIEVFYWADTGQLYTMRARSSTIDPPAELVASLNSTTTAQSSNANQAFISALRFPLLFIVISAFSALCFIRTKNLPKTKVLRFGGLILCVLIVASALLLPLSEATINRNALIWGSRSSGSNNDGVPWRKTGAELTAQNYTADYIASRFSEYAEYSGCSNYQGPGSIATQMLGNISYTQTNYPFTAVVDFDHGVGTDLTTPSHYYHFMCEDDTGTIVDPYWPGSINAPFNAIYDYQIYYATGGSSYQSNVNFAYISTCMSAALNNDDPYWNPPNNPSLPQGGGFYPDGTAVGMPFAWTHRIVRPQGEGFNLQYHMSEYGYSDPDAGNYCYLGFPEGSPALAQSVQSGYPFTNYSVWVRQFFAEALMWGCSVRDALDDASLTYFGLDFGDTNFTIGFEAIWPMYNGDDWIDYTGPGTLAVYGNSNMYLRGPELTVNAYDSYTNPVLASVYINGAYAGTTGSSFHVPMGLGVLTTVEVRSASYTFHKFTGYADFQNPITFSMGTSDVTITANYYANPPPQYDLYVSCGEGGSLNITSGHNYFYPQNVTVVATPAGGRYFDHWVLDENTYYGNPITVPMSSGHTLQAVFDPTYATTVNAYVTWDGYSYYYYDSTTIYKPAGSNYLSFGAYFVQAYNYYDSSTHYSDPDWYNLGTGTTIDVAYDLSGY